MKQRLGIAQALMHNPDLIVLDAPTTGLDPQGIVDIRELILKLSRKEGKTVILSSHQLSEIEIIANRMVIINKGQTLIEGEVHSLLNSDQMVVRFETDSTIQFERVISKDFKAVKDLHINQSFVEFEVEKNRIAEINKAMVNNGVNISAIEQKRKLEDYFIKMIQNQE